jgi:Cytochrome c7 and related cytochrome c
MKKLIILLFTTFLVLNVFAQSPHGKTFKVNCAVCHDTKDWKNVRTESFDHSKTKFPLVGQHKMLECRKCHTTLDFSKAKTECSACHADVHQQTVGRDCERCHTPNSWLVTKIKPIHQQVGFPLIGAHATADCRRCHTSGSTLRFDNINKDCYTCHKAKYEATTSPNHRAAGYATDCERCHNMVGREWSSVGNGFEHGFFPLTGGHKLECSACHPDGNIQQKISADCKTCHEDAYASAISSIPAHNTTKFLSHQCNECHSTNGWNSVKYRQHSGDGFTIYSGKHKGKWDRCTDCHNNDTNYKSNCKKCHD